MKFSTRIAGLNVQPFSGFHDVTVIAPLKLSLRFEMKYEDVAVNYGANTGGSLGNF